MGDTALEAVLRRDRTVVMAALVVIAVLAWAYTLWLAIDMAMPASPMPAGASGDIAAMDMSNMDMSTVPAHDHEHHHHN